MRIAHDFHATVLDFIENTRLGTSLFRLARLGLFAVAIFVGSRIAARQL